MTERTCEWCGGPIPGRARRDAVTCSQSCRQARHRFRRGAPRRTTTDQPLRFAYADPPYPGKAGYYREHPDFDGEVDHASLLQRLDADYPDGWALSTSSSALPQVLEHCPPGVRIAAWFRGERPARSYTPLAAWEPVVVKGGRERLTSPGPDRRRDALIYIARPRRTDPRRVVGAKPAAFCYWLFDLLGALPGDELVDLFPGSGGIARAWETFTARAIAARHVAPDGEHDATRRASTNDSCR